MIGRHQLYGMVLGLGIINALIRPVMVVIESQGIASVLNGFGISFVIWSSVLWSLYMLFSGPFCQATSNDVWTSILALFGFWVPAATVSWLVVGIVALIRKNNSVGSSQTTAAYSVIVFVAFRDPLASLVLELFATPILYSDAYLTSSLMSLWDKSVSQTGNLISGIDGHKLLIMTGCTSYTNLSIALLGWYTWTQATYGTIRKPQWIAGILVVITIVTINISRLALMGIGPEIYTFMHDSDGAIIVNFLMIATTIFITHLGCRYETSNNRLLVNI